MDAAKFILRQSLIINPIHLHLISATGSEWNERYVISRKTTKEKRQGACPQLYFKLSILDPRYTLSVPQHFTVNGLYYSFCNVMEQYDTGHFALMQDKLSEAFASTIVQVALNYRATAMQSFAYALTRLVHTQNRYVTHTVL